MRRGGLVGEPVVDAALPAFRAKIAGRFLGDVEVTEAPGQGGDHPGTLLVVGPGDRLADAKILTGGGGRRTARARGNLVGGVAAEALDAGGQAERRCATSGADRLDSDVLPKRRPGKFFKEIREAVSDRGGGVRSRGEAAHKGRRQGKEPRS
ncbi:hypothetical protein [Micromonospora deserti]|uniref:hypothetical protein n=1 Tax=Micromonospora deserti TaxID=2070366 RepID=UPI0013141418|nr:hypothetical protein [Micromonospora deserti]